MWEILVLLESVVNASSFTYVSLCAVTTINKVSGSLHRIIFSNGKSQTDPQWPVTTTCGYGLRAKSLPNQVSPWALPKHCPNSHSAVPRRPLVSPQGSRNLSSSPSPSLVPFPSQPCRCPQPSAASSLSLQRVATDPRVDTNDHRGPTNQ